MSSHMHYVGANTQYPSATQRQGGRAGTMKISSSMNHVSGNPGNYITLSYPSATQRLASPSDATKMNSSMPYVSGNTMNYPSISSQYPSATQPQVSRPGATNMASNMSYVSGNPGNPSSIAMTYPSGNQVAASPPVATNMASNINYVSGIPENYTISMSYPSATQPQASRPDASNMASNMINVSGNSEIYTSVSPISMSYPSGIQPAASQTDAMNMAPTMSYVSGNPGNLTSISTAYQSGIQPAAGPSGPTIMASNSNYVGGSAEIYNTIFPTSRVQEKEELQRLNDRFSAYVARVRQLGQQANNVDTSAFLQSTKILEDEIANLKNMYETELENLRKEIEASAHERHSLHNQNNKQQKIVGELQDRLAIETEKSAKFMDEINLLQQKLTLLEGHLKEFQIAAQRPKENVDQLERTIENLTREVDQWKHRYEHEQVARQEADGRAQQFMKKMEFSEQVHNQQASDYQSRLDTASASIVSLEARVRELSVADVSVTEMLKQVRETAETELKKFQIESEEQYNRNLSALKAQIDNDADCLLRYQTEKSELMGNIGELQAKIRNLEGQVINLQHQKQTLEDAVSVERNRSADNIQGLERKLREVQDILVVKMREITNAREANIPLKAEIEALKVILEEEEKRLRVPLGIVSAQVIPTSAPPPVTPVLMTSASMTSAQKVPLVQRPPTPVQQSPAPVQPTVASVQPSPATVQQSLASVQQPLVSIQSLPPMQPPLPPLSAPAGSGLTYPLYPYIPSPPLDTLYIPEALQSNEESSYYDPYIQGFSLPMSGPRYHYETTPSINRLQMQSPPAISPRAIGPVRTYSAPANAGCSYGASESAGQIGQKAAGSTSKRNVKLIPACLGSGRDYFDDMFHDLQSSTLFSKPRPKSSPLERMPSTFHDYTVSTSSAIGDLKILEINQDGKFVRLVNDGPTEFEFGGYMIKQNVGGHPVAVYRFPPRTKFPPDSTITVWAAMNDPQLHNPPTDFYWKDQEKWGTGPECTSILCRANGQAVAWTTAAHRFTKDAFTESSKNYTEEGNQRYTGDDESLTEFNMDVNGPRPDPVYLKREKQQRLSLGATKHPHGNSPCVGVHPQTGQQRPLRFGNDNSSVNRQSRTQTTRPDPIPGQPYAGAPAQRVGSAPLRKMGCNQPPIIRGNGTLANKSMEPGETCEGPSAFMKPHTRFDAGVDQVRSQHHHDFLPPMPRPPQASW